MSGLTQKDLDVLEFYARTSNRELYFNYLAQKEGNDGYGLLALGVVRNDNAPGAVANAFAAAQAARDGVTMGPRAWQDFGVDLIRADFALRQIQLLRGHPDLALNLPVWDVQQSHDSVFQQRNIDADAWTPRQLLEAARRSGGNKEAEKVWSMMLDNRMLGVVRAANTLAAVASRYEDAEFKAAPYVAAMASARVAASLSAPNTDPNQVSLGGMRYVFLPTSGSWQKLVHLESHIPVLLPVKDSTIVDMLNEERAVRLQRQRLRGKFHPEDANRSRPIATSPWLISEDDLDLSEQARVARQHAEGLDPTAPGHPRHALYQQCADGVRALDTGLGRSWDEHSARLAASVTTLAACSGFQRVDHVGLSPGSATAAPGATVFLAQGEPDSPTHLRAQMPTQEAVEQTPQQWFLQLQAHDQQRAQQREQAQAQAQQGHAAPQHLPYSDAGHPEHALYADVDARLRAQGHVMDEDRLNQITAHLHMDWFEAGWQGNLWVSKGNVCGLDEQRLWTGCVQLPLMEPAPPAQASMEAALQHDALMAVKLEEAQQQRAQQQAQGQGRGIG